jgi:hypothetical protein
LEGFFGRNGMDDVEMVDIEMELDFWNVGLQNLQINSSCVSFWIHLQLDEKVFLLLSSAETLLD